jgi:TatD DNase family protein
MLIDTHAHLDFDRFEQDLASVLERAHQAGVRRILQISTSAEGSLRSIALAEQHSNLFAAVGIHPCYVADEDDSAPRNLPPLLDHPKVVALGECGLDYHRESHLDASEKSRIRARQADFFTQQLLLAVTHKKNVVVHQRDSWDDTLSLLLPFTGKLRAVYHCFGGTYEQARQLLDLGHAVSFTGITTFKTATTVHDTVRRLPAGSFFLETDCPFLAPVPHRGQRCEPAHTRLVAEFIAQLRAESLEDLARHTTSAAESFFGLSPEAIP